MAETRVVSSRELDFRCWSNFRVFGRCRECKRYDGCKAKADKPLGRSLEEWLNKRRTGS